MTYESSPCPACSYPLDYQDAHGSVWVCPMCEAIYMPPSAADRAWVAARHVSPNDGSGA